MVSGKDVSQGNERLGEGAGMVYRLIRGRGLALLEDLPSTRA